ncbi:MAG: extracellular solute-binding protein [Spirochaetaceae bacterium]|nr:extracellular solute-binding protein [Spirochaetaceae bacterium]
MEAKKAVTLVFSQWWHEELEQNILVSLAAEFERTHPGIKIKLNNYSYNDMEALILNGLNDKIAGFTENFPPADILALDPRWLYGLIRNDMLEPLSPYKESSAFIPALQTSGQERVYDDWAFPLVSFMAPLFYNIEVLSQAGFDRPPKTWSEFLHYARAITNRDMGRFGTALSLNQGDPQGVYVDVYSWIWASGAVLLNQGKDKANFTSPMVVNALTFLDTLSREGLLSPDCFSKTKERKLEEFASGAIGMMIASVQDIEVIRKYLGDKAFGITTIPRPDEYQGKPAFGLTTWYAGISRESGYKEQAWEFISFLAKQSPLLAAASHAVPGSGNGLEDYLKGDSFYSKAYNIYEGGDGIQEFAGYPAVHVLDFIVREELYDMFEWRQGPKEAASEIQNRWEEVFQNALRFGS